MATLAVGERAKLYALAGVMRAGMSRANAHSPQTFVAIGGIQYAAARAVDGEQVDNDTLTITEQEGETPNTAQFDVRGFHPTDGQDVVITLGSINNAERLMAGTISRNTAGYVGTPANARDAINVIDYTWQLTRDTISQRWQTESGTVIARAIIAHANRGFTSLLVEEGLPVLDEFTVTNQTHAQALGALCDRLGATWKTTYHKDVRLGLTANPAETDPTTITAASAKLTGLDVLKVTRDLSPVITRQPVEGGGANALAPVAVGTTTIPVEDRTWYNPLGGTVVSGPQRITYTGIGLGYAPAIANWQVQSGPVTVRDWDGLAWAPALGLFVAVASSGTAEDVMTSPDGIVWTARTVPVNSTWRGVVWAPELSLFVAVSQAGLVMTSSDGITWTQRTAAAANSWNAITWSPELSLFVAVSSDGANRVMTSPDGITWTSRTAAAALTWRGVAWSPAVGLFAACAFSGGINPIMTSPDGITWTQRVAASSGYNAMAWSPSVGRFVAVGGTGGTGVVLSSSDGITWTARTPANGNSWQSVIWVDDLGLFVAVSSDGASATTHRIMASPDGIAWTGYATPSVGAWYSVAWGSGRLVAVGIISAAVAQIMTVTPPTFATLTGIPASGPGSILYPIHQGDPVNLRVVLDDLPAQAAIAALMGGGDDGIIEGPLIQDGRISETEARARGLAKLALQSGLDIAVDGTSHDGNLHAGRTLGVNLPSPHPTDLVGSFKVQTVTISKFQPAIYPSRTFHAANRLFTLEALLRQTRTVGGG